MGREQTMAFSRARAESLVLYAERRGADWRNHPRDVYVRYSSSRVVMFRWVGGRWEDRLGKVCPRDAVVDAVCKDRNK